MPSRREPGVTESVKDKADRYFADQCRRLGPIASAAPDAPRSTTAGRPLRKSLDRLTRTKTPEPA